MTSVMGNNTQSYLQISTRTAEREKELTLMDGSRYNESLSNRSGSAGLTARSRDLRDSHLGRMREQAGC